MNIVNISGCRKINAFNAVLSIVTSHTNLQKIFSLIILFSLQKCHDDGIVAEAVPRVSVPGLHPPEPLPPGLQLQVSLQANSRQELYLA